ncbi:MAG TPA: FIST N-terminal domain-containing protein, partial [Nitrospiria bacterium]|nr:FIST N-terminal domain-containing protein [Nitrospiria bacterium]
MKIEQNLWTEGKGWESALPGDLGRSAQLVMMFGSRSVLKKNDLLEKVKKAYPSANYIGCSTSGEIYGTQVYDESLVVTAVQFEHSHIATAKVRIENSDEDCFQLGKRLVQSLPKEGLRHIFVLSDGLRVKASDLIAGMTKHLLGRIAVTGGLSGDGALFKETLVLLNGEPEQDIVAALGFYGDRLKVGYGAMGGWDPFGPERVITRSKGNILYEFEGEPALALYKNYLGDQAKGLPATGLHYPLSLRAKEGTTSVVRTVLSVDEKEQSMIFAGDIPQGVYARLMRANYER